MPRNIEQCSVCGFKRFRLVETDDQSAPALNYVACLHCGLVAQSPAPTRAELDAFYSHHYWNAKVTGEEAVSRSIQKQKLFAAHIQSYIIENLHLTRRASFNGFKRILEVGSSFGVTLNTLGAQVRTEGGQVDLFAIEPSKISVEQGADNYDGVSLLGASAECLADGQIDTFDLIVLSHVLEHMSDPVGSLAQIARKMGPDSVLYIEVPNFYGHSATAYEHSFCFTESSLRNLLTVASLKPVAIDLLHHDPHFPLYVTCLAVVSTEDDKAKLLLENVDEVVRKRRAAKRAYRAYGASAEKVNHSLLAVIKRHLPESLRKSLSSLKAVL